jgi:hypothetical protein
MPKLFGEFLVDQQLVTEEQLASALVHQIKLMPSTVEVIFQHKLLPSHKIIEILKCQQTTGRDFRSSAKFLGFWSKDLETTVQSLLEKARTPLGEVLVSLGLVTPMTLTQSLDQYIVNSSSIDPNIHNSLISQFFKEIREVLEPQINLLLTGLEQSEKPDLQFSIGKINESIKRITVVSSPIRTASIQQLIRELNQTFATLGPQIEKVDPACLIEFFRSCLKVFNQLTPQMLALDHDQPASIHFNESMSEFNHQNQALLSGINPSVA